MMTQANEALAALDVLVGEWSMEARFQDAPAADAGARVVFEWLAGGQFLIQRWWVPLPEAPDGIALIGQDPAMNGRYLQHYFDSRGVARVYQMTLDGGVWKLWRVEADFSPLAFGQRFTGTISSDGQVIEGAWEICHDGNSWRHDFDLTYRKQSANPTAATRRMPS
jgi:hypothetical protein